VGSSVIVHLGDFGFWVRDPATRKYLFRVERSLAELDMLLLFVDGNHEDHDRLTALPLDPATGLRPQRIRRLAPWLRGGGRGGVSPAGRRRGAIGRRTCR
jgi:hypothetical protein